MTEITIENSFDDIENALRAHFPQEQPRKPNQPNSDSSEHFREYADAIDAYNEKMQAYSAAREIWDEKQSEIYRIWRFKLNQTYMPLYPESVSDLAYEQAYDRSHGAGYEEIRITLQGIVRYTNQVIAAVTPQ